MGLVLIVEEEEHARAFGGSVLQDAGHQVLSAASMDQAVSILGERPPIDLLFTEINMRSDLHGGLILARRAVRLRPMLPVLYTTGRGITIEMRRLFVPRFAFVGKPYRPKDLVRAVGNVIGPVLDV